MDLGSLSVRLGKGVNVTGDDGVNVITFEGGSGDAEIIELLGYPNLRAGIAFTNADLLGWENFDPYTKGSARAASLPEPFMRLKYPKKEGRPSPWLHPVFINSLSEIPQYTQFIVLKGDRFLVMAALSDGRGVSRLMGNRLIRFTGSQEFQEGGVQAVICSGTDMWHTISTCEEQVRRLLGLRPAPLPQQLTYLGWCSWNAFLQTVSLEDLKDASEKLAPLGVKWIVLDDGWEDVKDGKLLSFNTNSKFPGGLVEASKAIKRNMRWAGLWVATNGYWNGISPVDFKYKGIPNMRGGLTPDPREGFLFYLDYFDSIKAAGFDLVKLDNQSSLAMDFAGPYSRGQFARGVEVEAHGVLKGLGFDVIDCMSQLPENLNFLYNSSAIRNSMDYVPNSGDAAKLHAIFNVYNALFTKWFGVPDFDMFMSHDRFSLFHGLLRALSGGPVYLTDLPGKSDASLIRKLRFSDGRLPLPDGVLTPFGDVFSDPYNTTSPLMAHNVANGAQLVLLSNVNGEGKSETARIKPSDLGLGNALLYDYFVGESRIVGPNEEISFKLEEMEFKYLILVPKRTVTPVGLVDVFVSPKGYVWEGEKLISLDDGEMVIYSERELCGENYRTQGWIKVKVRRGESISLC